MNKLLDKFAALINVKTIVTLVVMGIFSYEVFSGKADPQAVMNVVTMVIAFYFGTQHEKKR